MYIIILKIMLFILTSRKKLRTNLFGQNVKYNWCSGKMHPKFFLVVLVYSLTPNHIHLVCLYPSVRSARPNTRWCLSTTEGGNVFLPLLKSICLSHILTGPLFYLPMTFLRGSWPSNFYLFLAERKNQHPLSW